MGTKVLVFESDPAFAGELRSELSNLGCTTDVVDDGNVGLQKASSDKPDLILLSIELPRMNGFSVCNKLKKDPGLKDIPLIIMSSESSEETFEQHRKLRTRAEDYVHKPIAFGELLRHIQNFVQLEVGIPVSEGIVIDDDIAIEEDERTQLGQAPPLPRRNAPSAPPKEVDPDMAAFADDAFGRLQGSNGAGDAAPEPAQPYRDPARRSDSPPKPTQGELDRAKARIIELETEVQTATEETSKLHGDFDRRIEEEQHRMEREMEELRVKLAQAGKTGGVSSREFLDLREALNKKDKEILALKEALGKKDKEIIDARDRSLSLERAKADLEDKIIAVEREHEDAKEKLETLARDKDVAKKASEDFKTRLEKRTGELEAKARELEDAKAKAKEDLARLESEMAAALEAAKAHGDQVLADAQGAAKQDKEQAIAGRETELQSEHGAQLAALHRAQQEELAKARAELAREKESALEEERTRGAEALAAREAELEEKRAAQVTATERERDERIGAANQERDEKVAATERERDQRIAELERARDQRIGNLERERDERIGALEAKAASELEQVRATAAARKAAADQQIGELQSELATTKQTLAALEEAKRENDARNERELQELDAKFVETAKARADLTSDMEHARAQIAALEGQIATTKASLQDTKEKLESETGRADRAAAKWEQDRSSLDKAKDALAVALSQIEEAEGRPLR